MSLMFATVPIFRKVQDRKTNKLLSSALREGRKALRVALNEREKRERDDTQKGFSFRF
jgi:hypothetical protein